MKDLVECLFYDITMFISAFPMKGTTKQLDYEEIVLYQ